MTKDFRAVNHVLTHSMDYEKPMEGRKALARFLGDGEFTWVDTTTFPKCLNVHSFVGILVTEGVYSGPVSTLDLLNYYL